VSFAFHATPPAQAGGETALVFHGTGGDEFSLVPFAEAVMPGAGIFSLRGSVSERGMPRFFRRFDEGVFDYDSIRDEAKALHEFLETQELGDRRVAIGYSNGANMAMALGLLYPQSWQKAVLFRPMVTLLDAGQDPVKSLAVNPDLTGKEIFLAAGERDPIVPPQNTQALAQQLTRFGAKVELYWHPGGHELTRPEIEAAKAWLGWA
jgi:predicted esterase